MPANFMAYDDSGNLIINTDYIAYGLLASGNMYHIADWQRWYLRSANLDPNNPGNYALTEACDRMYAFTVYNAIAPVAFVHGKSLFYGMFRSGNATTFIYALARPGCKVYVFDLMREAAIGAGMKCYADTAANPCTFNSRQVPLHVVGAYQPPPPYIPYPNAPNFISTMYTGGYRAWADAENGLMWNYTSNFTQSVGPGNFAATLSFSRSFAAGRQEDMGSPGSSGKQAYAYVSYMGHMDGVYGTANGIEFISMDSPRTNMIIASTASVNSYTGIPDRTPTAVVINIDNLPFPYTAY